MRSGCSLWTVMGVWCASFTWGCTSLGYLPAEGLACGSQLRTCDIHERACRQDVLDAVACLRDYDERVEQPAAHFIRLSDLVHAPGAGESDENQLRLGYSLLGLVSPAEVDGEAAQAARSDNIAAVYSAEQKAVYILEDPGGEELSEEALGVPLNVYLMSILAHEYVHFLQDQEFDLNEYSDELPERFDPKLARIAAVEGEATLYEAFFSYGLAGVAATDERILGDFERYVDMSEEAIREAESPMLEARGWFPYTYGGHSNAILHRDDGTDGVAALRDAHSTLEFIQRRWGEVEPASEPLEAANLELEAQGFVKLADEQLGPWVLNAFWSRTLGSSISEALDVAQLWQGDRASVWRNAETGETVADWAIQFAERGPSPSTWAHALERANPRVDTAWVVRVSGERCLEVVSSTNPDSETARQFAELDLGSSTFSDAGANSAESDSLAEPPPMAHDAGTLVGGSPVTAAYEPTHLTSRPPTAKHALRLPNAGTLARRWRGQQRLKQFLRQRPSRLW